MGTVTSKVKWVIERDGINTVQKLAYLRNTMLFMIMDEDKLRDLAREFAVQKLSAGDNLNSKTYVVVANGELSISTLVKKESEMNKGKQMKKTATAPQLQRPMGGSEKYSLRKKTSWSDKEGTDSENTPLRRGSLVFQATARRGSLVFQATARKFKKKKKGANGGDLGAVTEKLCVKKAGDFFSQASREATSRTSNAKVADLLSLTTVRAMTDSTVLTLTHKGLSSFLARNPSENSMLKKAFSADNITHLQQVPFLSTMPVNAIVSLSQLFSYEAYEPNETVFGEGDMGSEFYLVLQGKLKVLAYSQEEREKKGSSDLVGISATLSRVGSKILKGFGRSSKNAMQQDVDDEGEKSQSVKNTPAAKPATSKNSLQVEDTETEKIPAKAARKAVLETINTTIVPENGVKKRIKRGSSSSAKVAADSEPENQIVPGSVIRKSSMRKTSIEKKSSGRTIGKSISRKTSFIVQDTILDRKKALHIADLSASDYFGEFALLVNMKRSATVITSEKTIVMKLTKEHFNNFLKVQPEIRGRLELHAKERMMKMLYAFKIPFFRGLNTQKLIEMAGHCNLLERHAGDVLMRQGEPGSTFFIVYDGELTVSAEPQEGRVAMDPDTLFVGSYCGEISLVKKCDHMATVTVKSDKCVLLAITGEFFTKFFDENPSLLSELELRVMGQDAGLVHVLAHPLGKRMFKAFLDKEFTSEHLEFVDCIALYRKSTSESLLQLMVKTIVDQFFAEGAPHIVNVASAVRDEVNSDFEAGRITLTMFDKAHDEVMHMMENDNFARFKQEKVFQMLLNELNVYKRLTRKTISRQSLRDLNV